MIKIYKKIENKRAFTLIELLVTIAVLAILVLIAMPRLTGYTQKAELVRIQHDTKVMEQEMKQAMLDDEVSLANWDDNAKDLGVLVLKNQLFEKEGFAEKVDRSHLERHYNRAISASNGSSELGVGGTEIPLFDDEQEEMGDGYKVIPDDYKSNIKTRLGGTFYTNENGKVYYEHDKPLTTQKDSFIKKCDSPVAADLGYTFNYETMTITDYDHREQHLVIPASFKNPDTDECVPVRIIGKGAFMIGGYKSVVIPESVHTIEEEAFINNEFTEVYIPHSVDRIGNSAFTGDYISSVTIGRREGSVNIGGGAFYNRSTGRNIAPQYKTPSAKELGYVFDVSRGAIVSHSSSNNVLTIPSVITVNGVEHEVKQIDKGAFQGLGLITVILPESLERIEDYAFSGNQLIGVTIPESVVHIGNYAFSFNEQTHSLTGEKRATIKSVLMYEGGQLVEQFENINQHGDILENSGGPKVNLLDGRVTLLDHIFVTSIGNHVVDEEYGEADDGKGEPGQQSGPFIFYGPEELFDDDLETYSSGNVEITWDGDLAHREILITSQSRFSWEPYYVRFYDANKQQLNIPGTNSKYQLLARDSKTTTGVLVPKNATEMELYSSNTSGSGYLYEISAPKVLSRPKNQSVTSTSTDNSITLNWPNRQRVQVYKDGIKISDSTGTAFVDKLLYSNSQHYYELLFIDEYGNGASEFVKHSTTTKESAIDFRGLDPLVFDGDKNTSIRNLGTVTWDGDLAHREILITSQSRFSWEPYYVRFYDANKQQLNIPGTNSKYQLLASDSKTTTGVVVPKDATEMELYSNTASGYLYEISAPDVLIRPNTQTINSVSTTNSITLNWDKYHRVQIYKNGELISDTKGTQFTDKLLYSNSQHHYELLFIDEYGNGASEFVKHSATTKGSVVDFRGLDPSVFDGDRNTSIRNLGTVTWEGDLSNREILITSQSRFSWEPYYVRFFDKNNQQLIIPKVNSIQQLLAVNKKTTTEVVVPANAVVMELYSNTTSGYLYEIELK